MRISKIDFADSYEENGIRIPINLHVLLAPNMVGKSALLKALRIVMSAPLQKINANAANPHTLAIQRHEHRIFGDNPFSDIAREVNIEVNAQFKRYSNNKWETSKYQWSKYKEDFSGKNTKTSNGEGNIVNDMNSTFNRAIEHHDGVVPIILFIGTEYIHQQKPPLSSASLSAWPQKKARLVLSLNYQISQ